MGMGLLFFSYVGTDPVVSSSSSMTSFFLVLDMMGGAYSDSLNLSLLNPVAITTSVWGSDSVGCSLKSFSTLITLQEGRM